MLYHDVCATHSSQDADLMLEPLKSSCKRRSGWSNHTASDETVEEEHRGMLGRQVSNESTSNNPFQRLIPGMNPTKGLRSTFDVTQSRIELQAVHIVEAVYPCDM
jgi:hypothetical protein